MKKRMGAVLLSVLLALGILPASIGAAEGEAGQGNPSQTRKEAPGTEEDGPESGLMLLGLSEEGESEVLMGNQMVGSAAELKALGGQTIEGNIVLTDGIDMDGLDMTPIAKLTGTFDGAGYTIENLTLTGGQGSYGAFVNTGLIGELEGAVINLKVTNLSLTGVKSFSYAGGLVGLVTAASESKIDNCIVSGNGDASGASNQMYLGGLVGYVSGSVADPTTLTIRNCVSDMALTAGRGCYVGGLLGTAQYYVELTVENDAIVGSMRGSNHTGGGLVGYISSNATDLTIRNTILAGTVTGTNKYGVARNVSALTNLTCSGFYYDNDKNKPSYGSFDMLYRGGSSVTATALATEDLKALELEGFEVRAGAFNGYPVPVWTPAESPVPPAKTFGCTLVFRGLAEDGAVTLLHGETPVTAEADGSFAVTEPGAYAYTVTGMAAYEDVSGSITLGEADDGATKSVWVTLTYKDALPEIGQGTEEAPFVIENAAQLYGLAKKVNNGEAMYANAYVVLKGDITLAGSWTPLGRNAAFPFCGHWDGAGHAVTITVDNPNLGYFGFFGCLEDATVENLTVNGSIYCSEPYAFVGGLAGRARGNVTVRNCVNNATISSLARGSAGVGGLVGGYDDNVEYQQKDVALQIADCANNGLIVVTGTDSNTYVGGLVGANANCVQLENCQNTGDISSPGTWVGGLLGQAGYQTGACKPTITNCQNAGTLVGAAGKTNALYGKGVIASGQVTDSGSNDYTGGSDIQNPLLQEADKYKDVISVPAGTAVDEALVLVKDGQTASTALTLTCSQGEKDLSKGYVTCRGENIRLAKQNTTGKVVEETATLQWSDEQGNTLQKPVTLNIFPASAAGEDTVRQALMKRIAAGYAGKSGEWVVFDMAAYAACGFGENTTNTKNYLNLTVNELAQSSPLVTDRAKAEIILAALGIDSTKLTALGAAESFSNAEKLAGMNLGSSYFTAPWVLLAEEAGQVQLTEAQRTAMIRLLTENQAPNGLFQYSWGGESFDDADTTGTALAALARFNTVAYPEAKAFVEKAVAGLSAAQGSNGSYGNVNTDAMVITGLAALGIDVANDSRFVKNGCSLADALLLYVNDSRDGFVVAGYGADEQGEKARALATEQGFRALVVVEQQAKAPAEPLNIYVVSAIAEAGGTLDPGQEPEKKPFESDDTGKTDTPSGGESGGGSGGQVDLTVQLTIDTDTAQWYAGSSTIHSGQTVLGLLKAIAEENDLSFEMDKSESYVRAITCQGVRLGEKDKGPNSGWMFKVNGSFPLVGMADYVLKAGDRVQIKYTVDYTKEDGMDMTDPGTGGSGGGGGFTKPPVTQPEKPEQTGQGEEALTRPFADVADTDWFAQAVDFVYAKGLMVGTSDTTFGPYQTLSRAMVTAMLHRLAGTPEAKTATGFGDVAADSWYGAAVAWAAENAVVSGLGDNRFAPLRDVTREQLAVMLFRYARAMGYDVSKTAELSAFADAGEVSDWAKEAMQWAVANGLLAGADGKLMPQGNATRAEAAAVMQRFCQSFADVKTEAGAETTETTGTTGTTGAAK